MASLNCGAGHRMGQASDQTSYVRKNGPESGVRAAAKQRLNSLQR